ncbi:prepilin-type N-terminal cleavage/methylation domain-containing protein [Shewanella benthica]|uniref:MSHA pilin protein MshD n=1 Tax=Shewanella benthica KT99 TaxID=314608 RepID=A9DD30_9GAMM|nr:prepilin-type N-terminal cleavage/methylation domain-containing protein [Shewanella benthica]EDQ00304.1 MSHA pilin protein MshD [Shewanella benthica KT99]
MAVNSFKKTDMQVHLAHKSNGFTLIELIVGMVVLSIGLVMLTSMLFPQADRAAETLHRVRSAELAHSVMNEIWSKRYDQNTNPNGGVPACGATARPDLGLPAGEVCTAENKLGPETGENRNSFNDVDDYHWLSEDSNILNSTSTYKSQYLNYKLLVTVTYPNTSDLNRKLITVTVTTPSGEQIVYNAVRSNY